MTSPISTESILIRGESNWIQTKTVIWLIWFVLFVWLNQRDQIDQTDRIDQIDKKLTGVVA
jgi:hypothetical protein